jgi:D-amino-acid dehydrogenase
MAALKEQVKQLGVSISWNNRVTGWRESHGRIEGLRTANGEVQGDEYVVCAGSWSGDVLRPLRIQLSMQAGKGYSLTLPNPRLRPAIPAILTEGRVAVTPMGASLRFGGTMEIAGLNEDINPARIRGILKTVPKYYPQFGANDFTGIQPWRGLRPCSPDGLPYVGRTSRFANLAIAAGHAMLGLSLGPITGKITAEVLSDEKPCVPIAALNPDRYG